MYMDRERGCAIASAGQVQVRSTVDELSKSGIGIVGGGLYGGGSGHRVYKAAVINAAHHQSRLVDPKQPNPGTMAFKVGRGSRT